MLALIVAASLAYWYYAHRFPAASSAAPIQVERFTLKNGLTVVVMPNDRIPAVTHLLVVKAGAADDPAGKSGLAHYLEHLMFTGTKSFPEGVYDRSIARVGGTQNAYTTRDYTLYFATVATEHLPMVMAMEADRMQHVAFDEKTAARELKVITEERKMRVENSAVAELSEQLDALTFLNHPYQRPTIGWAEDMASFSAVDAKLFFAQHYHARNMVVVIAGDVTLADARRYAQHYYGGMKAGIATARDWPKEPNVHLKRHAKMRSAKAHEPRFLRQYRAASLGDGVVAHTMPLQLLRHYLGGGDTSVLYQKLVREQQLATAIEVDYYALALGPALFQISAIPAAGVSLPQLEAAIDGALADFAATPIDAGALARAKTLLKAEVIFAQDGLTPIAHIMGQLYAIGRDEQYFFDWSKQIDAVTAAAMKEAAAATLRDDAAVTGYLQPAEVSHAP